MRDSDNATPSSQEAHSDAPLETQQIEDTAKPKMRPKEPK